MRRLLIAGNWKMNGTCDSAEKLLSAISLYSGAVEIAVFPSYAHLFLAVAVLKNTSIRFGAQNLSEYSNGAFTGEISATMLKDLGCHYVMIGHSERRQLFSEKNDILFKKCERGLLAGLTPILCVGETLAEYEKKLTLSVVQEQLAVVSRLKDNCSAFGEMVIAYEPVWAIGTGKTATPDQAQAVHRFIRTRLNEIDPTLAKTTRILYGGSVKPDNAQALFSMPDVDGALVGGASLDADGFLKIVMSGVDVCNS